MDLRKLHLLVLLSCLCLLRAQVGRSNTVVFIDGTDSKYLRSHRESCGELSSMSRLEVSAAISVLLGIAPPTSFSAESSLKLDKLLLPNPFKRPRAVLMLDVKGVEDIPFDDNVLISGIVDSARAHIELSEEDEINLISIDEQIECDAACTDKEFNILAHWLGGSYVGSMESQDGRLEFPLASDNLLKLHVSKKAERDFALSLVSLLNGVKMATELHEDYAAGIYRPVELLAGTYTGLVALIEHGSSDVAQQSLELFQMTLAKLFGLLQNSYRGEIIGVILFNKEPLSDLQPILDVKFKSRSSRWLEELPAVNATAEVVLVRQSLAWITGIILLVSFLIGIYYLLYMPFTRDTLLYSNVKMD